MDETKDETPNNWIFIVSNKIYEDWENAVAEASWTWADYINVYERDSLTFIKRIEKTPIEFPCGCENGSCPTMEFTLK